MKWIKPGAVIKVSARHPPECTDRKKLAMIPNADNEQLIRRYLLGNLGPEDLTRVEIRLLEDAEFTAQVQLVEGELLEDYLDGTLSADEHTQCEAHFLTAQ